MEDNYKVYASKFKIALAILGLSLFCFIFLVIQIVPKAQEAASLERETKEKSAALADAERKLENLKKEIEAKKEEEKKDVFLKEFYKPITKGLDVETAISEEFNEVLQIMRENHVRARSIKYDYDPDDDNFVSNVPNKFHVCKITAKMVATYTEFEHFLRDLYKHEHFIDISNMEIVPYQKNKKILLVDLQIKLYAQKDAASLAKEAAQGKAKKPKPKSQAQTQPEGQAPAQEAPQAPPDITQNNGNAQSGGGDIMTQEHTFEEEKQRKKKPTNP